MKKSNLKQFVRDDAGSGAVEFAFVMPVALCVIMGVCSLGEALISDRKMIEGSEAMVRLATNLVVPAQCTVTSWVPKPTQTCTSASLASSDMQTIQRALQISINSSSINNLNVTIYRVVNQNNVYIITNSWLVSGTGGNPPDVSNVRYLPPGGSAMISVANYSIKLIFPLYSPSITLNAVFSL